MNKTAKRRAIVLVTLEAFQDILELMKDNVTLAGIRLHRGPEDPIPLPADTRIITAVALVKHDGLGVVVESASFAPTPRGQQLPFIGTLEVISQ